MGYVFRVKIDVSHETGGGLVREMISNDPESRRLEYNVSKPKEGLSAHLLQQLHFAHFLDICKQENLWPIFSLGLVVRSSTIYFL